MDTRTRLLHLLDKASPETWHTGLAWYQDANATARRIAQAQGLPLHVVAGVVATLSPGCKWSRNLYDAGMVCAKGRAYKSATTYGLQLAKAWRILEDLPSRDAMPDYIGSPRALKTRAFYWNILDPSGTEHVTIDRWVLRAVGIKGHWVGKREYRRLEETIKDIAAAMGLVPCQCQAIIWLEAKRG